MAKDQIGNLMDCLRRAVLTAAEGHRTDGQLLEDYTSRRDEPAVAAIVRRHGPMVWGVCRRVLHNHHDAEDAFQTTFLVLVRKAASIMPREMIGNWLYGVAHQTALKARAAAAKRHARERQVKDVPEPAAMPEPDLGHELERLLDQELSRLPDKYRAVIVLCDLDGKTRKEVARQLKIPQGTLSSRLTTARTMLAKRLARHGLAVSGGALAAVLSQEAVLAAVPPSVASSTIKAASVFAAGQAAAIPLKIAALTEGVLKAMLLSKLKNATMLLVVVFAVMAGAGAVVSQTSTGGQPDKDKAVQDAEKAVQDAAKALNEAKKALNEAKENADKQAVASDKGGAKVRIRWEYKSLSHDEIQALEFNKRGMQTADGGLNMLGDEGWELVAIEPPVRGPASPVGDRPALYVFKRAKK
jgi:RNA polymerase sigma factor (sigma-70 family)